MAWYMYKCTAVQRLITSKVLLKKPTRSNEQLSMLRACTAGKELLDSLLVIPSLLTF